MHPRFFPIHAIYIHAMRRNRARQSEFRIYFFRFAGNCASGAISPRLRRLSRSCGSGGCDSPYFGFRLNTGFWGALFRLSPQYGLRGRPISLSLNTGFGGASRLSSRNPIKMACPRAGSEGVLSPAPGRNSRSRRAYCPRAIARPPPHGKAIGGETQKKTSSFLTKRRPERNRNIYINIIVYTSVCFHD